MSRRLAVSILPLAVALSACGPVTSNDTDAGPVVVDPKLSDIQAKIFTLSCATSGCHNTASAHLSGNLDLTAGKAFGDLVGVNVDYPGQTGKRVVAGDTDASFLVTKIANTHLDLTTQGAPMPSGAEPLPAQHIQAIKDWITNGALNN